MRKPKYRGFNQKTNRWYFGFGWTEICYTEEFLKEKGLKPQAMLMTENGPIECDLESMGQFVKTHKCYDVEFDIYEGDVIESLYGSEKKYHVIWDDYGMFLFVPLFEDVDNEGGLTWDELEEKYGDNIVILSNSYERPELVAFKF